MHIPSTPPRANSPSTPQSSTTTSPTRVHLRGAEPRRFIPIGMTCYSQCSEAPLSHTTKRMLINNIIYLSTLIFSRRASTHARREAERVGFFFALAWVFFFRRWPLFDSNGLLANAAASCLSDQTVVCISNTSSMRSTLKAAAKLGKSFSPEATHKKRLHQLTTGPCILHSRHTGRTTLCVPPRVATRCPLCL